MEPEFPEMLQPKDLIPAEVSQGRLSGEAFEKALHP
jgi:hypothetical protein